MKKPEPSAYAAYEAMRGVGSKNRRFPAPAEVTEHERQNFVGAIEDRPPTLIELCELCALRLGGCDVSDMLGSALS